jgi:3-hydroxyacyl-[acyl-carrier-protein] dehydratase
MMDTKELLSLIPQRYPFIMIDRIVEIDPRRRAVGVKNISMNEPYFEGHFPGIPIMPGVLMIEAIAQVGIVLFKYENTLTTLTRYELVLGSVKSRFLDSAYPGDQMYVEVTAVKFMSTGAVISGICKVENRTICTAEISFMAKDISAS